jgi:hypothetical protein
MATKAQEFQAEQLLSRPKRAPAPKRRSETKVDTSKKGVSASDRKVGKGSTAARNASARAGRKASVALEDSATTPSRKSTRTSANRGRAASNLERREQRERRKPTARAAAARAKATTVRGRGRG